ncbi:CUE domain-containing protein 1 isoform X1 [Etheostoma spectabile]|uniref:CUE domain-containing protein 1 isoform X1 n=1 Tax=Etheostoma spectabile TaxID=54343 RepID=UPI0013AFC773|nr:CUE domain-containing protein 1 isoform X1 [Etheostoma spectabile]XP_032363424.1 CUE domain-containing protein 1 isoform X1 [Etheostoma spectabile]XP_032381919.1 CUE domain-containing protein 1-like isoform X1 [Etheostoma spectabile]XP_032381921.1 CUE domain-containing protein 1-like isoform X1 [Etheostoma spectabile]
MTSLFKRSSSNGGSGSSGSGGGGSGGQGQLNNSRSSRQVRRLEFNQAMEDFKTMFPSMDYEVIECVLRSNNGAVDATIDQLLQMSIDGQGSDDSSDSDDSIPAEILERTLEPDSSDEEPPPVYSPPTYDMHIYDRKYPEAPPTPPPRFEAQPPPGHQQVRSYRNWNPPLLGNLPDDFLRILPQQLESIKQSSQSSLSQPSSSSSSSVSSISQWTAPSCPLSGAAGSTEGPGLTSGATEQDKKLKQYLDDERIALFLQNEEFMRELQRNREFLMALERDRLKYESKKSKSNHSSSMENSTGEQNSAASLEAVSDDALFRDKLKHMGKSTRKKLFEIARTFSEKTKRKKSKRRMLLKHHSLGTANSTANLLDDVDGNPCEDGQPRRANTQEEKEQRNEPVV